MKRSTITLAFVAAGLLLLCQVSPALAQGQANAALTKDAESYFAAQDWAKAINAYEAITQSEPSNGRAWGRLGYALHQAGKYDRAVLAYQHAAENGAPNAAYNLACTYAKLNNKEQAFTWLKRALDSGSPGASRFERDPDLEGLRGDPRYAELALAADKINRPCMHNPAHRQFDFWVGEWDVKTPQGQPAGTSRVERVVDGCILLENWNGAGGGSGKSFNFFDPATGKWHQTWVGFQGSALQLDGEYKDNALTYLGVTTRNGQKTLERLTFFNLGPDRVRQLWEQSTDDGKTWNISFDGYYFRKQPQ